MPPNPVTTPVGCPDASLSTLPPNGSLVSAVSPTAVIAALFIIASS